MTEFPYTKLTGKIETFLDKLKSVGVPDSVTQKWLTQIGYASSNDRAFVSILVFLGFVDDKKAPTKTWTDYRGKNSKIVLANAIKFGYQELFKTYPNAQKESDSDLYSYFNSSTRAGEQVIKATLNTFKKLVSLAEFESPSENNEKEIDLKPAELPPKEDAHLNNENNLSNKKKPLDTHPNLHLDIQIHISPESSPEQIDSIFSSMAKHLYGKN
jgi:Family of unknown function (DUF5343)